MKRKIVIMLLAAMCIIPSIFTKNHHSFYPTLLQVVSCDGSVQDGFTVKLKNCHGFVYTVTWDSGDCDAGDFYTCIMDDMGTACIYDDTVVQARYERVDMY